MIQQIASPYVPTLGAAPQRGKASGQSQPNVFGADAVHTTDAPAEQLRIGRGLKTALAFAGLITVAVGLGGCGTSYGVFSRSFVDHHTIPPDMVQVTVQRQPGRNGGVVCQKDVVRTNPAYGQRHIGPLYGPDACHFLYSDINIR